MAAEVGERARNGPSHLTPAGTSPPGSRRVPHSLPHGLGHPSQAAPRLFGACDQSCLCPHPLMLRGVILRWESRTAGTLLTTSESEPELGQCKKSPVGSLLWAGDHI